MPRRIQKKNCKAAEIQKVPALGRSSRESGSPPRASASACSSSGLRPPASLVSVCSLSPALRRAGTFVIRNRCTQFRVADRRLGDDGAVLFLRRRSLRSSAQPAWLRSAPGWTGSMVAPWAALLAGAFVSGPAVFHGRELLAELPLVSELPFAPAGLVLGPGEDWACDSLGPADLGVWASPPGEARRACWRASEPRGLGEPEGWARGQVSDGRLRLFQFVFGG